MASKVKIIMCINANIGTEQTPLTSIRSKLIAEVLRESAPNLRFDTNRQPTNIFWDWQSYLANQLAIYLNFNTAIQDFGVENNIVRGHVMYLNEHGDDTILHFAIRL
jgi:hypothetical protein